MFYKTELIAIAANWLNPDYPLRQYAIKHAPQEFCLSAASFSLALDWIFSQWNLENIESLIATNPYPFAKIGVQVVAGNTPAVIAQAFLQAVILNIPQFIKIPSHCQKFCKLLFESCVEKIPALPHLWQLDADIVQLRKALPKADLVIAYGKDATIADIQKYISGQAQFVAHGHAVSAAIIFKEAANKHSLQQLAWDMLSYDQRGCLSPRVTFVEQGGELSPLQCATVFSEEILQTMAEKYPRGGLFEGEAINILQARMLYGFRGKVFTGNDWTVTFDKSLIWPEQSLPRFMPFKSFAELAELTNIFSTLEDQLISLGYAGDEEKINVLKKNRRICKLGFMQQQLIGWEELNHPTY